MSDRFPWFPFYVADWRLSNTVRAMTYEQRGLYLELLAIAWNDGLVEPSLAAEDATLATLTSMGRRWTKVGKPIVDTCFTLRDGRYYNTRLSHVWNVQRAKYDMASVAGKESARQRALQRQGNGRSTDVGSPYQQNRNVKATISDADTDRTKSSSAGNLASPIGAVLTRAIGRS